MLSERIESIAWTLDHQGKVDCPIRIRGGRSYLMKWFKPKTRGGPLFLGEHELVLLARDKAKPEQMGVE